jgi:hypothetical protein
MQLCCSAPLRTCEWRLKDLTTPRAFQIPRVCLLCFAGRIEFVCRGMSKVASLRHRLRITLLPVSPARFAIKELRRNGSAIGFRPCGTRVCSARGWCGGKARGAVVGGRHIRGRRGVLHGHEPGPDEGAAVCAKPGLLPDGESTRWRPLAHKSPCCGNARFLLSTSWKCESGNGARAGVRVLPLA